MMVEFLKGLARAISDELIVDDDNGQKMLFDVLIGGVFTEVGLGELLEAGQAMRSAGKVPINFVAELGAAQEKWDLWSERVRAALAGAEKGREGK